MQFKYSSSALNFVAVVNNHILGYIIWIQKSGFRSEAISAAIIELEQLAVPYFSFLLFALANNKLHV